MNVYLPISFFAPSNSSLVLASSSDSRSFSSLHSRLIHPGGLCCFGCLPPNLGCSLADTESLSFSVLKISCTNSSSCLAMISLSFCLLLGGSLVFFSFGSVDLGFAFVFFSVMGIIIKNNQILYYCKIRRLLNRAFTEWASRTATARMLLSFFMVLCTCLVIV